MYKVKSTSENIGKQEGENEIMNERSNAAHEYAKNLKWSDVSETPIVITAFMAGARWQEKQDSVLKPYE